MQYNLELILENKALYFKNMFSISNKFSHKPKRIKDDT